MPPTPSSAPLFDHLHAAALLALFGGLEDETHVARKHLFVLHHRDGGPKCDGGVAVVAAGVHDALFARGVGFLCLLLDR